MRRENRRYSDRPVPEGALDILYVIDDMEDAGAAKEDEKTPDFDQAVREEEPLEGEEVLQDYYVRNARFAKEHLEVFLDYIIDGTISFSKIFVPVYQAIESSVFEIERIKEENAEITMKYGLTVFRRTAEGIRFSNGDYFTESAEEFLDQVKEITFTGGSVDGYENIDQAVETGIRIVENHSPAGANRGILLFTDSMPFSDELVNFTKIPDCKNRGLRFAAGYLGSYQYGGFFKLVDKDGELAGDAKNNCAVFSSIEKLLEEDGTGKIKELVRQLMIQTSVR